MLQETWIQPSFRPRSETEMRFARRTVRPGNVFPVVLGRFLLVKRAQCSRKRVSRPYDHRFFLRVFIIFLIVESVFWMLLNYNLSCMFYDFT